MGNLCQDLDSVGFLTRMLQKSTNLLFTLLPLIFGQDEEFFGCCPLKKVQGDGDLAGVYYLVNTDQPFPDVCNLDDCTYKKEGNEDSIFCFKPSTRYASTCLAIEEGYGYDYGYGYGYGSGLEYGYGEQAIAIEEGYGYGNEYGYGYG